MLFLHKIYIIEIVNNWISLWEICFHNVLLKALFITSKPLINWLKNRHYEFLYITWNEWLYRSFLSYIAMSPSRITTSKWNKIMVKMYNGQVFCVCTNGHIFNFFATTSPLLRNFTWKVSSMAINYTVLFCS